MINTFIMFLFKQSTLSAVIFLFVIFLFCRLCVHVIFACCDVFLVFV